MYVIKHKSGAGNLIRQEIIIPEHPHIKSAAARVLLLDYYTSLEHHYELKAWLELRYTWLKRQLKEHGILRCAYCDKHPLEIGNKYNSKRNNKNPMLATIDHKDPSCRGGKDDPANFVVACKKCNHQKSSQTYEEYLTDPRLLKRKAQNEVELRNRQK